MPDKILNSLKNSSIVHWSHINFNGEYDLTRSFSKNYRLIEYDEIKPLV